MGLVIDTNFFIDVEHGRLNLASLDAFADQGDAYIAAITVSELLAGVHLAKTTAIRVQRSVFVEGIIAKIPVLDFTEEAARCYGEIYAHFVKSKAKSSINAHDLQIAATCLAHGYVVLTSNVTDFKKIPGLNVVYPKKAL